MHVPDGFLNAPTSVATAVIAAGLVGTALPRSRRELGGAGPARAGLVACFVFAAQMVNFPVGAGTSGHLIGGALAAVLVGPWTAVLVMTCVLLVQALFFADGGLTALGTNVVLLAGVTVAAGWIVTRLVLAIAPSRRALPWASGIGGFLSVPISALAFTALYAVGGAVPVPLPTLTVAMVGVHSVIGVGEGLITAGVIAAVAASQPQLIHGLPTQPQSLRLIDADGSVRMVPAEVGEDAGTAAAQAGAARPRRVALPALATVIAVATGLSVLASGHPGALERVAGMLGFEIAAAESAVAGTPMADYAIPALGPLGTSLAGLAGMALTAALVPGVASLMARSRRPVPHRVD